MSNSAKHAKKRGKINDLRTCTGIFYEKSPWVHCLQNLTSCDGEPNRASLFIRVTPIEAFCAGKNCLSIHRISRHNEIVNKTITCIGLHRMSLLTMVWVRCFVQFVAASAWIFMTPCALPRFVLYVLSYLFIRGRRAIFRLLVGSLFLIMWGAQTRVVVPSTVGAFCHSVHPFL